MSAFTMSAQNTSSTYSAGGNLSVTVNNASVYAAYTSGGSHTTTPTTATPVGGSGPFTYHWTYVSGGTSISATAPTSATTAFVSSLSVSGNWHVTVRDSAGRNATASVAVYFIFIPAI